MRRERHPIQPQTEFTDAEGLRRTVLALEAQIAALGGGGSFRGALVKKSVNQTAADYTSSTSITWDAEDYDTDSIHDTGSNTERLTAPAGVSYVRLSAFLRINNITAGQWVNLTILLNGTTIVGAQTIQSDTSAVYISAITPRIPVASPETDYYVVQLQVESDTSIDIVAVPSRFEMEIIE